MNNHSTHLSEREKGFVTGWLQSLGVTAAKKGYVLGTAQLNLVLEEKSK